MTFPAASLGALIALVVLVVCVVIALTGTALTPHILLGLLAALAVARLT
jgi:hypothetical protein